MREKVIIDIYDVAYEYCKSIKDDDLDDLGFFTSHTLKSVANGTPFDSVIEDIKAEIAKIEIPEEVKTVDGCFAFCQALEIADLAIDRVVDKHTGKAESEEV